MPYYNYLPEAVLENSEVKIYWDMTIITDRRIQHNKPDIPITYKKELREIILDIIIPWDDNIRKARAEKVLKYQELDQELKRMYRLTRAEVLPVVISCNGLVDNLLTHNLQQLEIENPKTTIILMQKAVLLATCATIRRVLAHD